MPVDPYPLDVAPHIPDPLPRGTLLQERFAVTRVLAATDVSSIYVGYDRWFDHKVVVKRLSTDPRPGGRARALAVRDFVREAHILSGLRHPQIPRLRTAFRAGRDCYIVMDYVDGVPLDQVLAGGPLARVEALAIADSLCDVVAYLHRQRPPIIHADIKPSNVMCVGRRVVLLDLGLARPRDPATYDAEPIGTLPYAPPEQRCGAPLDERSDIYALVVLLQKLFDTTHDTARHRAIARATALDPRDRFASVQQLRRALHATVDPQSKGAPPCQLLPDFESAVSLFVVFLLIALLFLLLGSHPPAEGSGALTLSILVIRHAV
jgi:serine/threonine protein kinase